jgi:hypothetical protein
MSSGLLRIVDAINAIGAASLTADELLKKLLADATAATAGITAVNTANSTGGTTHGPGVKATVHAVGPGLPADVIAALKSFGGR